MAGSLHNAKAIVDETPTAYRILWEGSDTPTWEAKGLDQAGATPALIAEWEDVKRVKEEAKTEEGGELHKRVKREDAPGIETGNVESSTANPAIVPQVPRGLSAEILRRIARAIAPLGGADAAPLRLTCKAFAAAARPITWSSIKIHRETAVARLAKDARSAKRLINSAHIVIWNDDIDHIDTIITFLETLPNLSRLRISSETTRLSMPISLADALFSLPIKSLEIAHLWLNDLPPLRDWIPKLDLLAIRHCGNTVEKMLGPETYGSPGRIKPKPLEVRQLVLIGFQEPLRVLFHAQARVESLELNWEDVTLADVVAMTQKKAGWKSKGRKPFSLRIHEVTKLFEGDFPNKQKRRTIPLVSVLNCVGAGPLVALTLPLDLPDLVPHLRFAKLDLPRLRTLTIATALDMRASIFDRAYPGLVLFLAYANLRSLNSLRLEGWLQPWDIVHLGNLTMKDLRRDQPNLFALLAILRSRGTTELRFQSSLGESECVYWIDKAKDKWRLRLESYTVRGAGVDRDMDHWVDPWERDARNWSPEVDEPSDSEWETDDSESD